MLPLRTARLATLIHVIHIWIKNKQIKLTNDKAYIKFVLDVFVYVELVIYCLLPFVCLVLANGVLVWKLTTSLRQIRHSLTKGSDCI